MSVRFNKYVKKVATYKDSIAVLAHNSILHLQGQNLVPLITDYGTIVDFATHKNSESVAFISDAEGSAELFVSQSGGTPKRLTFFGSSRLQIAGWAEEGILVKTFHDSYAKHVGPIHRICPETGLSERVNLGYIIEKVAQLDDRNVLQRCGYGYGSWRGYHGGTKGELWIGKPGAYAKLLELENNIVNPATHEGRVYFLNDGDGVGNVYSCDTNGADIKQHTKCKDYYVNSFCFAGEDIYYNSGGVVFRANLVTQETKAVPIMHAQNVGRRVALSCESVEYLSDFTVSSDQQMAMVIRGRLFKMGPNLHTVDYDNFYRCMCWLNDRELLAVTHGKSPAVQRIDRAGHATEIPAVDIGIVHNLVPNHDGTKVLMTNNRHELWLWELTPEFRATKLVNHSKLPVSAPSWSPDGVWVAYAESSSPDSTAVKLFNTTTQQVITVTSETDRCTKPVFDSKGKYLFFTKLTTQNITEQFLDFSDHASRDVRRLCIAILNAKDASPLTGACVVDENDNAQDKKDAETDDKKDAKNEQRPETVISDDLQYRIEEFPREFDAAKIRALGCSEKGPIWIERGAADKHYTVKQYEWSTQKAEAIATNVCAADYNDTWTAYFTSDQKLITCKSGEKLGDAPTDVRPEIGGVWKLPVVQIDTPLEWQAIYTESWYLMKEHFHDGKGTVIDWDALHDKYLPIVRTATSRADLNHIIYQMKGELKSSHAFILENGDVEVVNRTTIPGSLMADICWDGSNWIFKRCYGAGMRGSAKSPLERFGLKPGTKILQINGKTLAQDHSPAKALVGLVDRPVEIKIQENDETPKVIRTNAVPYEKETHYREWVASKKAIVGDEFGYIHIPDMVERGLTYFYQQYKHVYDKPGLIIDVRNNNGGCVSTIILSTLLGKRLGVDLPKYHANEPYMARSPRGPMVLLIDQHTGSDGDIFAQSFKDLKLGPVIGKRTWGGVIGIMPRYSLMDNGLTAQPEFACKFNTAGFDVEGGGVAPDIELDSNIEDEIDGVDHQLLRGMAELQLIINRQRQ